jgi:ABC-type lipoprotein export system ATPase subunit
MVEQVIHIRDLAVRLGNDLVVCVESLDVVKGEVVVLDAESGAGKSTALGLISGAIPAEQGPSVVHKLSGQDVNSSTPRTFFAGPDRLGFVLQTNVLMPYLNVRENIELPMTIVNSPIQSDWANHLIGALGLADLVARRPNQISVGQRQRVSIARALLGRPDVLLLDEPVSALDPANAAQVEELIEVLVADTGSAVILASHQAFRGAFAKTRRVSQRTYIEQNCVYSLFSDLVVAPEMAVQC